MKFKTGLDALDWRILHWRPHAQDVRSQESPTAGNDREKRRAGSTSGRATEVTVMYIIALRKQRDEKILLFQNVNII